MTGASAVDGVVSHGLPRRVAAVLVPLAIGGCELIEVETAVLDDVVVAEVYVHADQPAPGRTAAMAFLHRTIRGSGPRTAPGATVAIVDETGRELRLVESEQIRCIGELRGPSDETVGTCYYLENAATAALRLGSTLTLEIVLQDGGRLSSQATLPGGFEIVTPAAPECALGSSATVETMWTRSAGSRAYVNETFVYGLWRALGLTVFDDRPVEMVGVSATEADTAITFPDEYGAFSRFDLDRVVRRALTGGLPAGTRASVTITAIDQNYVNWARGGGFNPVGEIRHPSVTGDGTGVFGASVTRRFVIVGEQASERLPACGGRAAGA